MKPCGVFCVLLTVSGLLYSRKAGPEGSAQRKFVSGGVDRSQRLPGKSVLRLVQ